MPDEGEQIQVEQQSTAGKWILVILAILFVAAFGVWVCDHATARAEADHGP